MISLRRLYVNNNELASIHPSLGNLVHLVRWYWSLFRRCKWCLLTFIHRLMQLISIWLYCLQSNPYQLYHTIQDELNVSFNAITAVPAELFQCVKLRRLVLSYNNLTTLPSDVYSLRHLKVMRNNIIIKFGAWFKIERVHIPGCHWRYSSTCASTFPTQHHTCPGHSNIWKRGICHA